MNRQIARKKDTGEAGNPGQFGSTARGEADVEFASAGSSSGVLSRVEPDESGFRYLTYDEALEYAEEQDSDAYRAVAECADEPMYEDERTLFVGKDGVLRGDVSYVNTEFEVTVTDEGELLLNRTDIDTDPPSGVYIERARISAQGDITVDAQITDSTTGETFEVKGAHFYSVGGRDEPRKVLVASLWEIEDERTLDRLRSTESSKYLAKKWTRELVEKTERNEVLSKISKDHLGVRHLSPAQGVEYADSIGDEVSRVTARLSDETARDGRPGVKVNSQGVLTGSFDAGRGGSFTMGASDARTIHLEIANAPDSGRIAPARIESVRISQDGEVTVSGYVRTAIGVGGTFENRKIPVESAQGLQGGLEATRAFLSDDRAVSDFSARLARGEDD